MLSSVLNAPAASHLQLLKAVFSKGNVCINNMRIFHTGDRSMIRSKVTPGLVCGQVSPDAVVVARPRSIMLQGFLNTAPKGGFFFAGSLIHDPVEEAEIAANMAEVAELERSEKEEASGRTAAEKAEIRQVILREQPNVQLASPNTATKETGTCSCEDEKPVNKEEYLRTGYYKNFHRGQYDLIHFYTAAEK